MPGFGGGSGFAAGTQPVTDDEPHVQARLEMMDGRRALASRCCRRRRAGRRTPGRGRLDRGRQGRQRSHRRTGRRACRALQGAGVAAAAARRRLAARAAAWPGRAGDDRREHPLFGAQPTGGRARIPAPVRGARSASRGGAVSPDGQRDLLTAGDRLRPEHGARDVARKTPPSRCTWWPGRSRRGSRTSRSSCRTSAGRSRCCWSDSTISFRQPERAAGAAQRDRAPVLLRHRRAWVARRPVVRVEGVWRRAPAAWQRLSPVLLNFETYARTFAWIREVGLPAADVEQILERTAPAVLEAGQLSGGGVASHLTPWPPSPSRRRGKSRRGRVARERNCGTVGDVLVPRRGGRISPPRGVARVATRRSG